MYNKSKRGTMYPAPLPNESIDEYCLRNLEFQKRRSEEIWKEILTSKKSPMFSINGYTKS